MSFKRICSFGLMLTVVACSSGEHSQNSSTEIDTNLKSEAGEVEGGLAQCATETLVDPERPAIVGVKVGMQMADAASSLECAGYTVNYKTKNVLFQGGQTNWTSEIIGSQLADGHEDLVRLFIIDLAGPDNPKVFGVIRDMNFRSNFPTFTEFDAKFHSAYARSGSVIGATMGGTWYVEHQGKAIDELNIAFRHCKPLVQSSQMDCGFSQGYFLERFGGNPNLVIKARIAIHDRDLDRTEFSRLNQRVEEDKNAALQAAQATGQANIPAL